MTVSAAHDSGRDRFSHDLLLHDSDLALVQGTRAFVQQEVVAEPVPATVVGGRSRHE